MKRLINTSNIIKRTSLAAVVAVALIISLAMSTHEVLAYTIEDAEQGNMQAAGYGINLEEYTSDGMDAVSRAASWVGKAKYIWGACAPGEFDASGFVSYCLTGCYKRIGTTFTFLGWPQTMNPHPGDVCVNSGHCGIYVGGGQMIHASNEALGVSISPVQSGMIFVSPIITRTNN